MSRGRLLALIVVATLATVSAYLFGVEVRTDSTKSDDESSPVVRTTPSDDLVIERPGSPSAVAVGAGATWVLSGAGDAGRPAVTVIDPSTGEAGARTGLEGAVRGQLAAGEGAAWIISDPSPFRLTRVDARTRSVRVIPRKARTAKDSPNVRDLAVGAGGVWLLEGDRVLRAGTTSGRIERSIRLTPEPGAAGGRPCQGSRPSQSDLIAVGADAVWVASICKGARAGDRRAGFLSRIDPRANRVTRTVPLRYDYSALAVGRVGVWAATSGGPALHRIGRRSGEPAAVRPLPEGRITGLGVSRDAIWVAQEEDDGELGVVRRVDRRTGRVSIGRDLAGPPSNLAVGNGGVWVVDMGADELIRIRP